MLVIISCNEENKTNIVVKPINPSAYLLLVEGQLEKEEGFY